MYFKTDRLGAFQSADNRAAGKVNLRSGLMVLSLVGGLLAVTLLLSFGLRWQAAIVGGTGSGALCPGNMGPDKDPAAAQPAGCKR